MTLEDFEKEMGKLLERAREVWDKAKNASYEDFWDMREWGKPTPLREECVKVVEGIEQLFRRIHEYVEEHGTPRKKPEGPHIVAYKPYSYKEAPNEPYTEMSVPHYLPVSSEFKKKYDELAKLHDDIKWKLVENRFVE